MRLDASDLESLRPVLTEILREALSIVTAPLGAATDNTATAPAGKLLWTEQQAAEALGVSSHSLERWRRRGYIKSHTHAKPILYTWPQIEAIAAWMPNRSGDE